MSFDHIDHADEARGFFVQAEEALARGSNHYESRHDVAAQAIAAVAQVHATLALAEQMRVANLIALATLTEVDTDGDMLRADAMDRLVQWVPDGPDDEHPEMRPEIAAALGIETKETDDGERGAGAERRPRSGLSLAVRAGGGGGQARVDGPDEGPTEAQEDTMSERTKTMSESIRERLARVLWESMSGAEIDWREYADTDYRRYADDLLAEFPMLAGVTDEMVETGARATVRWWRVTVTGVEPDESEMSEFMTEFVRKEARAVLEAVYGKEQAGEL